jgi:hypothetical protein
VAEECNCKQINDAREITSEQLVDIRLEFQL